VPVASQPLFCSFGIGAILGSSRSRLEPSSGFGSRLAGNSSANRRIYSGAGNGASEASLVSDGRARRGEGSRTDIEVMELKGLRKPFGGIQTHS